MLDQYGMRMPRALIVCIGNSLIADDALGWAVFERLEERRLPQSVRVEFLELGGIRLLDILDGEDLLIVVDAVRLGSDPGTLHVLDWQDLPEAEGLPVTSHDIGLSEAIRIGRVLFPEKMPQRIILVGVEGKCFDQCGVGMTPQVEEAVKDAMDSVIGILSSVMNGGLGETSGPGVGDASTACRE
jgi:hydrogenase maturation protease